MLGKHGGKPDHEPMFFQTAFTGAALATCCCSMWTTDLRRFPMLPRFSAATPRLGNRFLNLHQRWLGDRSIATVRCTERVTFSHRIDTNRPLVGSYGLTSRRSVSPENAPKSSVWRRVADTSRAVVECLRKLDGRAWACSPSVAPKHDPEGCSFSANSFRRRTEYDAWERGYEVDHATARKSGKVIGERSLPLRRSWPWMGSLPGLEKPK